MLEQPRRCERMLQLQLLTLLLMVLLVMPRRRGSNMSALLAGLDLRYCSTQYTYCPVDAVGVSHPLGLRLVRLLKYKSAALATPWFTPVAGLGFILPLFAEMVRITGMYCESL